MRFEPIEKSNDKDNSILFYLRSSLVPVFADLIISCFLGAMYFMSDMHTRYGRLIGLLSFGFWLIAFLGFAMALIARISTLVFVTKFRLYGQIYSLFPSHRRIEISLDEIKDVEIRATIGTKLFRYAHLIIHPYNGKKITLRNIRNAEELAIIILKLQDKLQRKQPEKEKNSAK
ncbi:MAG: PH domain-containing protein [Clostridiales bacterium]|nr:PH domain-containing protein [Clostridiales bacterium]